MNIYLNIEKLICYAKLNLLLDEADEIYVRNAIMQKLGLEDYVAYEVDEEEIEGYETPFAILDSLFDYALEKGVCKESDRKLFDAQIMDLVSLRPGEVEDMFDSLVKNPSKALDWAFDYAVKNGSAKTEFTRWENKGDKNIEVVFADCCGAKACYPHCCFCVEGEGYGLHANERYIPLPINGNWFYKASKRAYFNGLGNVVSAHEPLKINERTLNTMFDFIEFVPSWFICTANTPATEKHAHFFCGSKQLPIHKASEARKFKNKEYPYISIVQTDWYTSTIRLSCTNREKLIEFALKLIGAYGKDRLFISLRKVESKFVIDLSFIGGEVKKENGSLAKIDVLALSGVFRISDEVAAQIKTIEKYLTKEIRFTPMCLSGGMEAHAKLINTLLEEVGANKLGAVEAALDVKEECKKTLVAALSDLRGLSDDELENLVI